MKNRILKISIAFLSVFFAACLDDDKNNLDPSGASNILEFANISIPASGQNAVHPLYVVSFGVSPSAEFDVIISYSGPNSNDKSIDITLEVDPIALADYNTQNGTNYEVLADDQYDIASMTVTMPAGQTKLNLPVTVYPDKYDLTKNFALPLRIVSASSGVISQNWGAAIFGTVVKNKYDGEYTATGTMLETTNPNFVGYYPKYSIYLTTVNGNTNNYLDNEYGLQGHLFWTGTGLSYWGGFSAQFQFDDATGDVVSVVNAYGQGNNNRVGNLDPTGVNKVTFEADGVTPKTIQVSYFFKQLNGCACNRVYWNETYTYVGPRP
jgi:hypothetical protein